MFMIYLNVKCQIFEIWGFYSVVGEDSSLLWHYVTPAMPDPQEYGAAPFQNVRNSLPVNTASHSKRLDRSQI